MLCAKHRKRETVLTSRHKTKVKVNINIFDKKFKHTCENCLQVQELALQQQQKGIFQQVVSDVSNPWKDKNKRENVLFKGGFESVAITKE